MSAGLPPSWRPAGCGVTHSSPHKLPSSVSEEAAGHIPNFCIAVQNEARVPGSPRFGTLLRDYRIAAGLSQEALAERARMSVNGISALERGYRRSPKRGTLALLGRALELDEEQRQAFETAARAEWVRRYGGASVTVGPWPSESPPSLPLAMSSFIGRETELGEIATLVRAHRLVTVTGAGGVGKTQTALQAATTRGDDVSDGICFVGLAPVRDASAVATAIATALGVQEAPSRTLLETITTHLKNKQLLLILDNCEHVIEEAAHTATFVLAACPNVNILATSREPFRVAAEHVYRLPSLDLPSAIALFTDRARAVDSQFGFASESDGLIADLCQRLDGIPLAIELAAARVNTLPVKDLATKIGAGLQILSRGERTALPRQQTMRATIEWSYNLLSPAERWVFERLSVFAGGGTLDAIATVCLDQEHVEPDLTDVLTSLVSKSLVISDFGGLEPRYRLLEPFRDYAREKLATRGEQSLTLRRHVLACIDLVERNNDVSRFESDERHVELARPDIDNFRAALQWALTERGDIQLGQQLAGVLSIVWVSFATVEGKRWIDAASEMVDESTSAEVLASLDSARTGIAWQLGDVNAQLEYAKSAVARCRERGNEVWLAGNLALMGNALCALGRTEEAKVPLEECLKTARALDYSRMEAWAHIQLSLADEASGDVTSARNHVILARPLYRRVGSHLGEAVSLLRLSALHRAAGNAAAALESATDSARLWRLTSHGSSGALSQSYALSLLEVCRCLVSLARYRDASIPALEALNLAREGQFEVLTAAAYGQLGAITALLLQDAPEMHSGLELAARLLGSADARISAADRIRRLGATEGYEQALRILDDAMGSEAVAEMMAAGAGMTADQISDEVAALEMLDAALPRPSVGSPAER